AAFAAADRQSGDAAGHHVARASAAVVVVRTQAVSATGRPEREQAPKRASAEGRSVSATGRPEREQAPQRARAEGRSVSATGRPEREQAPKRASAEGRSVSAEGSPVRGFHYAGGEFFAEGVALS